MQKGQHCSNLRMQVVIRRSEGIKEKVRGHNKALLTSHFNMNERKRKILVGCIRFCVLVLTLQYLSFLIELTTAYCLIV